MNFFRRDRTELAPGTVIATFANPIDAKDFIRYCKDNTFCVTGSVDGFAVRKKIPESDAARAPGADGATRPVSECAESGGFSLRALTPKGERLLPELARIMGQLEVDL